MPAGSYKYNGREVVFYHGTRGKIDAFKPLSYFTSSEKAAKRYGKNLYKAYLHLANPLMLVGSPGTTDYYLFIDMTEAKMREYQEFGYDSVIYEGRLEDTDDEEMISAVIFDTAQVEEVGGLFHGGQLPSVCNKLYKDHHEVWDQMDEIEKNLSAGTASKYAGEILRLADSELLSHFYEEEKELFPVILSATNKKDIDELILQHKQLVELIDTIQDHKRPSDILLFCKQIKEHIKKEESLMSAVTPDPFKKPSKKKLPGTITRIAGRSQKKAGGYVDNGEEKTLLSLFDFSGAWSKPFADAGWNVIQWDIKLSEFMDINLLDSAETVLEMFEDVNGVLAAVPCTDFASSGAQYWEIKDEDGRTHQSVEMVNQVMRMVNLFAPTDPEYDGVWFWAIENPVGRMDKLVSINRKPWYFHPYEFAYWLHLSKKDLVHLEQLRAKNGIGLTRADALFVQQTNAYTKKTGLWGDFAIPEKKPVDPVYAVQGKTRTSPIAALTGGKGAKTKELRSNTPLGFAQAFFEANHNYRAQFQPGYWVDLGWSEKEERKILADYNRAEPGVQKRLFASGGSMDKIYETTIHSNAFKKWFGDWEPAYNLQQNDPAIDAVSIANLNKTVSKVVDPTGKPLVVYHFNTEGNNDFTEFKPRSFGSYGENSMFYFATDKNWVIKFAQKFAYDSTLPVKVKPRAFFLDIKKPLDLTGLKLTPSEWLYFLKEKNLLTENIELKLTETPESNYYRTELFSWQIFRYDFGHFRQKLIENGYDGIKITDSNYGSKGSNISYVAIYPHQIKIADGSNATFDASSPDIRFADGGQIAGQLELFPEEVTEIIAEENDVVLSTLPEQMAAARLENPNPQLTLLSFGGGQDGWSILYRLIYDKEFRKKYAPNDLVVAMSDTGNEFPYTYQSVKVAEALCKKHGIYFVLLTPDMGYHTAGWQDLKANLKRNKVILGAAMGSKACTISLKINVVDKFMHHYMCEKYGIEEKLNKGSWKLYKEKFGTKARVLIGFAKNEEARVIRSNKLHAFLPKWKQESIQYVYPMIEEGWDRAKAQEIIGEYTKDIPPPSNCMLCFYQSDQEILWLWRNYPAEFAEWVEMEKAKLDRFEGLVDKNYGVYGAITLPQKLEQAQKKYGHMSNAELWEYKMSHGHCVKSAY